MTDHHRTDTEAHLVGALREYPAGTPDLDHLATHTVRSGTRIRRRRQGAAVIASVALVGAASFGVAAMSPGDQQSSVPLATTTPLATETPTVPPPSPSDPTTSPWSTQPPSTEFPTNPDGSPDLPEGWPVLLDATRVAPDAQYDVDEVRFYVVDHRDNSRPKLSWRPADTFSDYDLPDASRTAVLDGDPAWIVRDEGIPTVVGPVRDGGFLTLTDAGLTDAELIDLAATVRRPRPATGQ